MTIVYRAATLLACAALSAGVTVPPAHAELLDGRTFHGEIRDDKGVVRATDVLTFRNGVFHSETCARLGFPESPYWVRTDGKTVYFLVEVASPEAGEMRFAGAVHGDKVDAKGVWTKERWYWSIRREIRFSATEKK